MCEYIISLKKIYRFKYSSKNIRYLIIPRAAQDTGLTNKTAKKKSIRLAYTFSITYKSKSLTYANLPARMNNV